MGGWHSEITDCWFVFCELGLDALKWVECSSIAAMFWFQIIQIVVLLHYLTEGGNQQSRGDSKRRRLITPENHVFDDFLLAWEEMLLGPSSAGTRWTGGWSHTGKPHSAIGRQVERFSTGLPFTWISQKTKSRSREPLGSWELMYAPITTVIIVVVLPCVPCIVPTNPGPETDTKCERP